jgi:hypothetical protein
MVKELDLTRPARIFSFTPHEPEPYSILSFAFAAATVCHCIFEGASAPPCFNAWIWSIT